MLFPVVFTYSQLYFSIFIGCEITPSERQLFSLPTRLGGLGIVHPVKSASRFYQATVCATAILTAAIRMVPPWIWIYM